ncbi:MAG TPA: biotin--[acetyl-CoA-carboxylase] ligase, partial [Trichocoleus sp.]
MNTQALDTNPLDIKGLNAQKLSDALKKPPQQLGVTPLFGPIRPKFRLHLYDCVTSTNTVAWDLVNQGCPAGTVVIAQRQEAGRGQWGRPWQSPLGGLYLSLVLQPEVPVERSSQLTLAAAWGLSTSFSNLGLPVQIKWPNDLVVQGRKLGGVLTETRVEGQQITTAVVGVGLNVTNPVPPTGISTAELRQIDSSEALNPLVSLETVAAIALYGLNQGYLYWQSQGAAALLAAYRANLANLGQIVVLDGHQWQVEDVTESGRLRVK